MLGPEGRGFHMMMSVLDKGRVGIAALSVGILQAALEASVEYARVRKQFGRAIAEFQAVQWMVADMAKDLQAARLLVHAAATKLAAGARATLEASMAKCFASDAAVAHTANAVQIHGGSGYIRVDWFTPDGLQTWGDTRLTVLGTDGYIEVRKNIDIAGRPGGSHVFLVDQKETRYVDCRGTPLTYGERLVDDVLNRTETSMPQAHVFLAMELALRAEAEARRLSLGV